MRFGVVGVTRDRVAERGQGRLVEAPVVQHLAVVEARHRALPVQLAGPGQPLAGEIEVAARLLGQAELEHGGDVVGIPREEGLEFGDRLGVAPQSGVGAAQFPASVPILRLPAHPLPEVHDPAVVVPALAIGDVEIGLRDLHPRIELERANERRDRLFYQTLLVVEDPEVVVGAGVGGVDAAGKGAQDCEVALRQHGTRHRFRTGEWRRRLPAATAYRATAGSGR